MIKEPLILFDGVCNLCNHSVQFVIEHDPNGRFHFASLQSEIGQQILAEHDLPKDEFDTVLLLQNGELLKRSTAALRIAAGLERPYSWLHAFIWVPRPVRDFFYRIIANNRFRWFGKSETMCWVATPELRERFVE